MHGYEDVVIIGYGETPYHRRTERTALSYLVEAITLAVNHAGVAPQDVDGLGVVSFQLSPDNTMTVAEHLGIPISWGFSGVYGGASGIVGISQAARAIQAGDAEVVVVVAGDAFTVESHDRMIQGFSGPIRDYVNGYGFAGANGIFALVQQRHMHEYGTTREQLGQLAVTQRFHASLNPNALLRDPITIDDYICAKMIADPIRLYDCVMPCSGADAVVLTSRDRAEHIDCPSISIMSMGQLHNYSPGETVVLEQGWSAYATQLYEQAGMGPEEMDMVQLYDDYPIMEVIQLEDLGFCEKGAGGRLVAETDISIAGRLPINTGGGQLSAGQSGAGGGMIGVVEAARQLLGQAGERQVSRARAALVSGFGMVSYGRGLATSAMILASDDGRD